MTITTFETTSAPVPEAAEQYATTAGSSADRPTVDTVIIGAIGCEIGNL